MGVRARKVSCLLVVFLLGWESGAYSQDLAGVVRRAERDYNNLDFPSSKQALLGKLQQVEAGILSPDDSLYVVKAYLTLGLLYHADAEDQKTVTVFREVARLSPDLVLSETDYPPRIRELFDQARQGVLADKASFGTVSIRSPKKAKVFMDGLPRGPSPLIIRNLPEGRHYLTLEKEGYKSDVRVVQVPRGETTKVTAELEKLELTQSPESYEPQNPEPLVSELPTTVKEKSLWKKPAFWVIGSLVLAGAGLGLGLAMSHGGGGAGTPTSSVSINTPPPGLAR